LFLYADLLRLRWVQDLSIVGIGNLRRLSPGGYPKKLRRTN
jgi:hypothetical protein